MNQSVAIQPATAEDVALILQFICELAEFERLRHEVTATEEGLRQTLFGPKPFAEVVIARDAGEPVGFALFFHNYSTFLGKPGIYLEDLYVRQECRGKGYGEALLRYVARVAVDRGCGRFEWSVLDWNQRAIDFYKKLGALPMHAWTIFRVTGEALNRLALKSKDDE
jgi:GNAT superfamily N-acetyltransferase